MRDRPTRPERARASLQTSPDASALGPTRSPAPSPLSSKPAPGSPPRRLPRATSPRTHTDRQGRPCRPATRGRVVKPGDHNVDVAEPDDALRLRRRRGAGRQTDRAWGGHARTGPRSASRPRSRTSRRAPCVSAKPSPRESSTLVDRADKGPHAPRPPAPVAALRSHRRSAAAPAAMPATAVRLAGRRPHGKRGRPPAKT